MRQITLNIPETDIEFFLKLIEKFKYTITTNDFQLTDEQLELLDKRSKTPKDKFISADQLISNLRNKYDV